MKRYACCAKGWLKLRGQPFVQCDICGFIDPWEFAKDAPIWYESKVNEWEHSWSHGANPDAHFCPSCSEALCKENHSAGFYRMIGEDE